MKAPDAIDVAVNLSVNGEPVKPAAMLLGEVLAELPAIGKNSEMKDGPRYKYRGIEDVLNVLNPILSIKGLVVLPFSTVLVSETTRQTSNGKAQYNVKVQVEYRWYGPAGDFVPAAGIGEASDTGDKAVQKALTSAYKYMLFHTLCISTEEGNDSDVDHTPSMQQEAVLSPQEQRKQAFEREGKTIPEGWVDFEEFDTEHQTYLAGIAELPKLEQDHMKGWRRTSEIPWPCSKADMVRLCDEVVRMKEERFEQSEPLGEANDPPAANEEAAQG